MREICLVSIFCLVGLLGLGACGRSTENVSAAARLQPATPFVPSNAQPGWTADLVTSVLQCQGNSGVVNTFCSCEIKAVTAAYTPSQVSQAASDAQSARSTADVQALSAILQNCLAQVPVSGAQGVAIGLTAINLGYQFSDGGCSTDAHVFNTNALFCIHLQRKSRNNSCALDTRQQVFTQFCSGTFQETF